MKKYSLEESIKNLHFQDINFIDQRELNVFYSYIRGFSIIFLDNKVKKILEIGSGQSTSLLSKFGDRFGWQIITIDMNPESILLKLRNSENTKKTFKNISFRKGVSVLSSQIQEYFNNEIENLGNVNFNQVIKSSNIFLETIKDKRRIPLINSLLGMTKFNKGTFIKLLLNDKNILTKLIKLYRTPNDELEFHNNKNIKPHKPLLKSIMEDEIIDVVFLDSGEFSSMLEWDIVEPRLRVGGYIILHDIYFPKSFKNWLVAGSIMYNPCYNVQFIDETTPQGLLVAQRIS
jgi:hypothetical protein